MNPLIIDQAARDKIQQLRLHAERNIFSIDDLLDIIGGRAPFIGDRPGFCIYLENDYRVVFSIESQNAGLIKTFSASVSRPGMLPNEHAIRTLLPMFGIEAPLEECLVEIEEYDNNQKAITIRSLR